MRSSTPASLSAVPTEKRKQVAATLGLFAVLFIAVGAVAATGPGTAVIRTFVVIALVVAVLLALMAWGVVHSVRLDTLNASDEEFGRKLDDAIAEVIAAQPRYGSMCNCGHEHDPTEMHIVDAPEQAAPAAAGDACAADGAGHECTHSCATCLLADYRAPEDRTLPRPAPRPRPAAAAPARRPSPSGSRAGR